MEILKKLTQNNFNEVAKLIQNNQLPEELMTGNLKNELKRYRLSYSTPASIDLAQKHQNTVKFGYRPPVRIPTDQVCGCCNIRVYNEEIPLCEKVEPQQKNQKGLIGDVREYKLTADVALFLSFVKTVIFFTFLNTLLHSIFNLVSSQFFGKHCADLPQCKHVIWNTLSLSNKYGQEELIRIVDVLNLVAIVVSILFLCYNRRRQYKISALIDCQTQNQADYTLLVSNIPILEFPKKGEQGKRAQKLEFFYRKHLQQYFNNQIQNWLKSRSQWGQKNDKIGLQLEELMSRNNGELRSNQIVKTVSLCYNLSRLEVLQEMKSNLIQNFETNQVDDGTSLLNEHGDPIYSERFATIPERISFLNDCELVLNGQFARDNSFLFSVTHFVGLAFISFQYEHYKEVIQRMYVENPLSLNYNGNYLTIEDASHPTDIYWQNMKVTQKQRRRKIISSYLILTLVLVFTFFLLFFLQMVKEFVSGGEQSDFMSVFKTSSITVIIAVIILAVNYGLNYLSRILTEAQRRKTRTDYAFSVLTKTMSFKLINTIMIYFFVALILRDQSSQGQFMLEDGLIFQITTLMVVTNLLHLIKSLIYPQELFNRFLRWFRYRKIQDKVQNKFQRTLNKEFELPEFDFTSRYSFYLVTLYTALFYSYLVPVGVPIVCIIFFIQYWIDKWTLFRRSSLKYHFGFFLSNETCKILESSVFVFALGNLIFSTYLHDLRPNVLNLVGFGVATGFLVLVWITPKKMERIIFGEYEYNQKYTYDDCVHDGKFESTYWTQNPASFLIQEEKVTGKRKAVNPAINRKSKEGEVFLSQFN